MRGIPISKSEPNYKKVAIIVAMLQRNEKLKCITVDTFNHNDVYNFEPIDRSSHLNFGRTEIPSWNPFIKTDLHIFNNEIKVNYAFETLFRDANYLDPIRKYTSVVNKLYRDIKIDGSFVSSMEYKDGKYEIPRADDLIDKVVFYEQNALQYGRMLSLITQFDGEFTNFNLSIREFGKLKKYKNILDTLEKPSRPVIDRFLDLVTSFKDAKKIDKFKNSFVEFNKNRSGTGYVLIQFLGNSIIRGTNFYKYRYIDHPGINFLSSFLEETDMITNLESQLSKEVIAKM